MRFYVFCSDAHSSRVHISDSEILTKKGAARKANPSKKNHKWKHLDPLSCRDGPKNAHAKTWSMYFLLPSMFIFRTFISIFCILSYSLSRSVLCLRILVFLFCFISVWTIKMLFLYLIRRLTKPILFAQKGSVFVSHSSAVFCLLVWVFYLVGQFWAQISQNNKYNIASGRNSPRML